MKKQKRGLSPVISAVFLVALSVAAIAILWAFLSGMINDKLSSSGNCLDLLDKDITIKRGYTCFNDSGTNKKEIDVGIDFGNSELDKIKISLSSKGGSGEIEIPGEKEYLKEYQGEYGEQVNLSTGTKTYTINISEFGMSEKPDSISITPTVGGSDCGKSDSISKINDC